MKLYSINDSAAQVYNFPFCAPTDEAAKRAFVMACEQPESPAYNSAADYDLYRVGEFNQDSGAITPTERQLVMRGKDMDLNKQQTGAN